MTTVEVVAILLKVLLGVSSQMWLASSAGWARGCSGE